MLLGAGTYSAGESWPQSTPFIYPPPNVPAGVSIEGQSSDAGAVLLQGADATGTSSGLAFAGSATVRNLRLRGFNFALVLRTGTAAARLGLLQLENLSVIENYWGVAVNDAESLSLKRVVVNNNRLGLTVRSVTGTDIRFSEFNGNTEYGMNVSSRLASPRGTVVNILGSTINQNGEGISSTVDILSLSSTVVKLNGTHGLRLLGNPTDVSLTGTTTLEQNGSFQLLDGRDANTGRIIVIDRAMIPGLRIAAGYVKGPSENTSFYSISKAGNSIYFR